MLPYYHYCRRSHNCYVPSFGGSQKAPLGWGEEWEENEEEEEKTRNWQTERERAGDVCVYKIIANQRLVDQFVKLVLQPPSCAKHRKNSPAYYSDFDSQYLLFDELLFTYF